MLYSKDVFEKVNAFKWVYLNALHLSYHNKKQTRLIFITRSYEMSIYNLRLIIKYYILSVTVYCFIYMSNMWIINRQSKQDNF